MRPAQQYIIQLVATHPESSFLSWKPSYYDEDGAILYGRTAEKLAQLGYLNLIEVRPGRIQAALTPMGWASIKPNEPVCEYLPGFTNQQDAWAEVRDAREDTNKPDWVDVFACEHHGVWHTSVMRTK